MSNSDAQEKKIPTEEQRTLEAMETKWCKNKDKKNNDRFTLLRYRHWVLWSIKHSSLT